MKFARLTSVGPYSDTRRKRLAYQAKLRRERERLPLFGVLIAEEQSNLPPVDDVMAERAVLWERQEASRRAERAARWRRARVRLFGYGDNTRRALRTAWRSAPYPADPTYFLDLLHRFDVGDLDLDHLPWTIRIPVSAGRYPVPR